MIEVMRYLQSLGVQADLFLDARSDPAEAELLRKNGVAFQLVENEYGFVEGVYGKIAEKIEEEWAFILTSDEIPTHGGLVAIDNTLKNLPANVYTLAFPRYWVFQNEDGFCVSQADFIGMDYQWRIIRHRAVQFVPLIHTAGFVHEPQGEYRLPEAAAVYHLDWVVHSRSLRERKLGYYGTIDENALGFRKWYLPEDYIDEHKLVGLTDPAVLGFAKRVARLQVERGWSDSIAASSAAKAPPLAPQ